MNVLKNIITTGRLTVGNEGGTTPASDLIAIATNSSGLMDFKALASIGGSVTTAGGSTGVIPKWATSSTLGNSLLSDDGTTITNSGRLLIGTTTASTNNPQVDVIASGGTALVLSDVITNSTQKIARFGFRHYTNSEEPILFLYGSATVNTNSINYGGGTSVLNAAQIHSFYTAATNTTVTGTEVFRISNTAIQTNNLGGGYGAGLQNIATQLYDISGGPNLLRNGMGALESNFNFSGFTYDESDSYAGKGCFKASVPATVISDELIPIDIDKYYKLTVYAKAIQFLTSNNVFIGIDCFDIDGNEIIPRYTMKQANTSTTLSQPLAVNDMVINVASVSSWSTTTTVGSVLRHILVYSYRNSFGYTYPNYTYSRNLVTDGYYGTQQVTGCVLTNQGSGYTNGTYSLGFSGGAGSGATGTYYCSGGNVVGIKITATGSGYTSAPTLSFPSGGGSSAAATALTTTNSTASTLQVVAVSTAGSGYGAGATATVTFSGGGASVQATGWAYLIGGVVDHIVVTAQGTGYSSNPTVAISGSGTGATAFAAIGTGIDSTNNKIYIKAPYPIANPAGGAFPIGTALANGSSGSNYKYIAANLVTVPNTWTKYTGTIGGIDSSGTNLLTKFQPGTAYVKVLWLANYNSNPLDNSRNGTISTAVGTRGSYTSVPTITFSTSPSGAGTPTTTGTANMRVTTIAVNAGGSGYSVGNVVTISGGTGQSAVYTVSTVSSGAITAVTVVSAGLYTVLPTTTGAASTVNPTGGTGATFNLTFELDSINVTQTGYGYNAGAPTISFSGGSATATATVGNCIQGFSNMSFTETTNQNVSLYQNVPDDLTVDSLTVKAVTSQTGKLINIQNASGVTLTSMAVGGDITMASANFLLTTGRIGVGTGSPNQAIEVSDSTSAKIRVTRSTGPVQAEWTSVSTESWIGTITNHKFSIYSNNLPAVVVTGQSTAVINSDSVQMFDSAASTRLTMIDASTSFIAQGETSMFVLNRVTGAIYTNNVFDLAINATQKRATFTLVNVSDISGITGTTTTSSSTTVTGTSTKFLSQVGLGDRISMSPAPLVYATVTAIASDTSLTVNTILGNGSTQTMNIKSAITRWDRADGTTALFMSDDGKLVVGDITVPTSAMEIIDSSTGAPATLRLTQSASASANSGPGITYTSNRTTGGATNVAQISGLITDTNNVTYKGAIVFKTADAATPAERWRINNKGHLIHQEVSADPALQELTGDLVYQLTEDRMAIYMKNDKFVIAYDLSGVVNYLTIPLNGSTTTWTQSTTAP